MSNYKINIDKPNPSKEESAKHKSFDNIRLDYETIHKPFELRKRLFRDKKLIRFFILIVAVLLALFFGTKGSGDSPTEKEQEEQIFFESSEQTPNNTSN